MQEGIIRGAGSAYPSEKAYMDKLSQANSLLGTAPQQPLSSKINSALDMARATLDQLNSVADRALGSYPTPVPSYSDVQATYVSTTRQVDELTDVLHQIASVSQRLSGGL